MPDNSRMESYYPQDWFKKAADDLRAAEVLLRSNSLALSAFHLQQAIEKYLKGFLISKGWRLRRIHNLEELLDEAISYVSELEKFRSLCQTVTGYYSARYPFIASLNINRKEISETLDETKIFVKEILEIK